MHILLSNDDGYLAPGLQTLLEHLRKIAKVTVVAPERNRSGASNSLTLERPLRLRKVETGVYAVDGTPADCVHLAITELFEEPPAMVIAGINAGENLGEDVLYSGTVAAAMEGCLMGCPALAASLVRTDDVAGYSTAAAIVCTLVERRIAQGMPNGWLLNVNIPITARGTVVTRLGQRHREATSVVQTDPRGQPIYWIGPVGPPGLDAGPGTDFFAIANQYVSVTPLQTDLTAYAQMEEVGQWLVGTC
ncbi:MAG: 5'/3'-nucleotidase SurE [Gammaproteobacteria bacterium]|nr:5'/3'-nucleotidase SurE [Gammaproteobacteria bacterium]